MPELIECSALDLRYETFRMRNPGLEEEMLCSVRERGLEQPLAGVDFQDRHVLLDGFKRLRCAQRLGLHTLPYVTLARDQILGILALLRGANPGALSILEEARFVDELSATHGLTATQIAEHLSRSKAWVSLRLRLIAEATPSILQKLLTGQFPVYAYLYTVRPFMRINSPRAGTVEEFVNAVSGKALSVREIKFLFQGFLHGSDEFREQVRLGRLKVLLRPAIRCDVYRPMERQLLEVLDAASKQMRAVVSTPPPKGPLSSAFAAQAGLVTEWILKLAPEFLKTTRSLHVKTQRTAGDLPAAPAGHDPQGDLGAHAGEPKHRPRHRQGTGPSAQSQGPAQAQTRGGTAQATVP